MKNAVKRFTPALAFGLAMTSATAVHAANWHMHFKGINNSEAMVSWDIVPAPPSTAPGVHYKVCWERVGSPNTLCNNHEQDVYVNSNSGGYSASTGQMGTRINDLSCGNRYKVRVKKAGTLAMDTGTFRFDC